MTLQIQDVTFQRASLSLQVKFAGSHLAEGEIEGYASTFGGEPDTAGDIIAPGAFTASLAAHKAAGTVPVMLWGHDIKAPIGRWTELREDARGLYVKGQLNLETVRGRDAHAHLKAGDVGAFSIGYQVPTGGFEANRDGTTTLKAIHLLEVSVVAVPANPHARLTGVKSITSKTDLERLLREAGLARGAAVKLAAGGWPALTTEPPETPEVEHLVARVKAARLELQKLKG